MINVSGAVITYNGKYLITQRAKGKNEEFIWELPGGKQEGDETMEECTIREIKEELGIDITVDEFIMNVPVENERGQYLLYAYMCSASSFDVKHNPNIHNQYKWIDLSEFKNYEFLPGDKPVIAKLQKTKIA
ncbi:MAG: (deoxy)nucleoside triphosphate pyrophosphohydrolase [Lactobacillus sp.]|jgi:8-oxo-dGTP diphosphatase|nr:(deoxy)nucleoside triphosphate pyrophosphohydrolase [Lactobacillus sp.]